VEFLSTVASVVLLGVAGAMCLVIMGMMIKAKRENHDRDLAPVDD